MIRCSISSSRPGCWCTSHVVAAVRLTIVSTEAEAEVLCGLLRGAEIECAYRWIDVAAGTWTGTLASAGPSEILVDEAELVAARELAGVGEA